MKKYIVRAVCLAAVFLLLCSTAFAGQSVTLDKYGVSFSVPDGMEWVATEDADDYVDGLKSQLEEAGAVGVIASHSMLSILVRAGSGKAYEEFSFTNLKNDQIIEKTRAFLEKSGDVSALQSIEVYDAGSAKWSKISYTSDGINAELYHTVQGNTTILLYPYVVSDKAVAEVIDSFSFGKPSLWHKIKTAFSKVLGFVGRIFGDEISNNLLITLLCVSIFAVYGVLWAIVWLFKKIFIRKK